MVPWSRKVSGHDDDHEGCSKTDGQEGRTLSSSMPSSLPLGTTVTISISQRKETSEGVRPGGSGWAIFWCDNQMLWHWKSC